MRTSASPLRLLAALLALTPTFALPAAAAQAQNAAAQAGAGEIRLDRQFIIGRWTDDGDCRNAIEFAPDGRFIIARGSEGLWHLAGDRLTMTADGTTTIRIVPRGRQRIDVINTDNSRGSSTRCPGGAAGSGEVIAATVPYLVGRWTDDGDCGNAIEFSPDGDFVTGDGGRGRWRLEDDVMTMSALQTARIQIVPIARDIMIVVNADGSLGRSTRCP